MTMPKFEPASHIHTVAGHTGLSFFGESSTLTARSDWEKSEPLYSADQLTEAYEAGKRDAIPEGWALVPKDPTDKQIRAMEYQSIHGSSTDMAKREYKAMIAAAPKGE